MFNIGIRRVVLHLNQNATLLHPCCNLFRVLRLHIMRMRVLRRNIRRDNDVKLCMPETLQCWSLVERIERCTVACEDMSEDGETAVAVVVPFIVEVCFFPGGIQPLLTVEPGVDQNRFAVSKTCIWRKLHLRASQQECADSLGIVAACG